MQTLYIHVHPSREEFAEGYPAGLNTMCDDDVQCVVVVNPLVPVGKILVLSSPEYTEVAE